MADEADGDRPDGEYTTARITAQEAKRLNWFATSIETSFDESSNQRRVRGFPDRPPPPKGWKERLERFFGVDEDQAEREIWRIRHALALQGYLKPQYVPKLSAAELEEVDAVCFRVPHNTGRSVQYTMLCRPIPPRKPDVWEMAWSGLKRAGHVVKVWGQESVMKVNQFGHGVVSQLEALLHDDNAEDGKSEDGDDDGDDDDDEDLSFFDNRRTAPSEQDGDQVDFAFPLRSRKEIDQQRREGRRDGYGERRFRGAESSLPPSRSNRSKQHIGLISWLVGSRYDQGTMDDATREKLEDVYSHRPYFIYWASLVHILVLIISLSVYGFAPVGVGLKNETATVTSVSGGQEIVNHEINQNFWFGPSFSDLIHLGAKFGPCMRRDDRIYKEIDRERLLERDKTGCCVRSDLQLCYQSVARDCTDGFFHWLKWNSTSTIDYPGRVYEVPTITFADGVSLAGYNCFNNSDNLPTCYRKSGSVCGDDPRVCRQPRSVYPHDWPDDITRWPVCQEVDSILNASIATSVCDVSGRPCCIGNQGVCSITTKEHCDFVKGHYHDDKRLCSEVDCLEKICGLTTFLVKDKPDHFYRLWTSLCLHVGIIHLVLTLIMHVTLGRHIEKLIGWFRTGMIYILSGIGGNLVSAVFVPYQAEVGPGSALFGLLAALIVEVIKERALLRDWPMVILKISIVLLIFFFVGLLPFVDNYAHVGGFVFGLFSSAFFIPYFGQSLSVRPKKFDLDERRRLRLYQLGVISVSLAILVLLFILFSFLFWEAQVTCSSCYYFNCIPLKTNFCKDLNYDLRSRLGYVIV